MSEAMRRLSKRAAYSLPALVISSISRPPRIIAVSERTKEDVVRFYGVDPDRIDVIYQGCDESFRRLWGGSLNSTL